MKNSTLQFWKDCTTLQTPPVFLKSPIHNGRSETYLKCYLPSHSLPRSAGKNSVSAFFMTFWKMVHFWFYGQEFFFNVPRALKDVSFQTNIHLTLLKILKTHSGFKKSNFPLCLQWTLRLYNIRLKKPRVKIKVVSSKIHGKCNKTLWKTRPNML